MAWYKTGTVSITNGQTVVTGTGTAFASNARVGDGFTGPDGVWYEVINIASQTVLSIYPAYKGATVSNSPSYMIAPLQGYNKETADRLRAITDSITVVTSVAGRTGNVVLTKSDVGLANVDNTSDANKPVSTATQTALNGKKNNFTTLPITEGGTGGNTLATARSSLGLVPQTGTSDATAFSLMINGAWGLGGSGISISEANIGTARPIQFNIVSAGGLGVLPVNINGYMFHWTNPNNTFAYQTFRAVTGGPEYVRYLVAGTWGAWDSRDKSGANSDITSLTGLTTALSISQGGTGNTTGRVIGSAILGAVSQASGVPTGAIMSQTVDGTTGDVTLKLASGLMIYFGQRQANATTAAGGNVSLAITRPSDFVGNVSVSSDLAFFVGASATGNQLYATRQSLTSSTNLCAGVFINMGRSPVTEVPNLAIGSTSAASFLFWFSAIGRWFT